MRSSSIFYFPHTEQCVSLCFIQELLWWQDYWVTHKIFYSIHHPSIWTLHKHQSIHIYSTYVSETRYPHLESQHALGWKGPSVQPPCHGTSLYWWQAKARQREKKDNKKTLWISREIGISWYGWSTDSSCCSDHAALLQVTNTYNCNSRHQRWARGVLAGAGKGQTSLDNQKPILYKNLAFLASKNRRKRTDLIFGWHKNMVI